MMSRSELPVNRLTTTDESGRRLWLYPHAVNGYFRKRRDIVHFILVLILVAVPWIKINGQPLFLLDPFDKRFVFFGHSFFSHDTPILVLIVVGFVLLISFVTSVWGRVWCGWACPQTVFIDGIFRRIERWVEGDSYARRKRDFGPWTAEKFIRKTVKWIFYFVVSFWLANTLLSYFVGTDRLFLMMTSAPTQNLTAFSFVMLLVAATLFDFGWFREQFCTIACPYGRFQSVLMDDRSMVVHYNADRGEPRSKLKRTESSSKTGQCVSCSRCVQVCPTGIDIRRGLQMECIACTACIDVCNEVMTRLSLPQNLISYKMAPDMFKKPRAWVYLSLLATVSIALTVVLINRQPIHATFVRAIGVPYEIVKVDDQSEILVNNLFRVHLKNQSDEDLEFSFQGVLTHEKMKIIAPQSPYILKRGEDRRVDVFVQVAKGFLRNGQAKVTVKVTGRPTHENGKEVVNMQEVQIVGPF